MDFKIKNKIISRGYMRTLLLKFIIFYDILSLQFTLGIVYCDHALVECRCPHISSLPRIQTGSSIPIATTQNHITCFFLYFLFSRNRKNRNQSKNLTLPCTHFWYLLKNLSFTTGCHDLINFKLFFRWVLPQKLSFYSF